MWDPEIRGNGVKTLVHLKKGEFVCEYKGDIITPAEEEIRMKRYASAGEGAVGCYTFGYKYNSQDWV